MKTLTSAVCSNVKLGFVEVAQEMRAMSTEPPCVRCGTWAVVANGRQVVGALSWLTMAINGLSRKTEEGALAVRGHSAPVVLGLISPGVQPSLLILSVCVRLSMFRNGPLFTSAGEFMPVFYWLVPEKYCKKNERTFTTKGLLEILHDMQMSLYFSSLYADK